MQGKRKMEDLYRYYYRKTEELWQNLLPESEMKKAYEVKYLEPSLRMLALLQRERVYLDEMEREAESFIRKTEEQTK